MSLLLADDVSSSQESTAASAPMSPLPSRGSPLHAAAAFTLPHPPSAAALQPPPPPPRRPPPPPAAVQTPPRRDPTGHPTSKHTGSKRGASPGVEGVRGQRVARNGKKGAKRLDFKESRSPGVHQGSRLSGVQESGHITARHDVSKSKQELFQNAAMLSTRAQEAMSKYRLRQKNMPGQAKAKAKTKSAPEGACPAHPAAKCRATRGTSCCRVSCRP